MINNPSYSYNYGEAPKTYDYIESKEKLFNSLQRDIDSLQYQKDLVDEDIFKYYKSNVSYDIAYWVRNSQKWLSMLKTYTDSEGKKLDGRRKYDEKVSFNVLTEQMKKLLGTDLEVTQICEYNFGEAWYIYFTADNQEFYLTVPIVKGVSKKSFDYYRSHVFKMEIHVRSDRSSCCWNWVASSFDEGVISEEFAKYISKVEVKE